MRSTHSYTAFRWGHKWVVLAILVQFPFATRAWALPVLTALYHSPAKAAKATKPATKRRRQKAEDQTKAQAKERARRKARARAKTKAPKKTTQAQLRQRHKTPSELMRQLLSVLTHWFPDRQFVFAGDGGYGTHALARFNRCHGWLRPRSWVGLVTPIVPGGPEFVCLPSHNGSSADTRETHSLKIIHKSEFMQLKTHLVGSF